MALVIEARALNLVKTILVSISLVESVQDISEGLFTYDEKKYIDAHLCLIDVIKL